MECGGSFPEPSFLNIPSTTMASCLCLSFARDAAASKTSSDSFSFYLTFFFFLPHLFVFALSVSPFLLSFLKRFCIVLFFFAIIFMARCS